MLPILFSTCAQNISLAQDSLSTAKNDGHNQGMREADLHAVYDAIPEALQDRQVVMVGWIVDYRVDYLQRR